MQTVICRDINGDTEEVQVDKLIFRPSIYGVIVQNEKVLLVPQWNDGYDFPGGGVELGESLEEAFGREVEEETGLEVALGELVLLEEDFFIHPFSKQYLHSILMYYTHRDLKGEVSTDGFDEFEKSYLKKAEWIPIRKIESLKFYNPVDSVDLIKRVADGKR